jgi:hypothetical protein
MAAQNVRLMFYQGNWSGDLNAQTWKFDQATLHDLSRHGAMYDANNPDLRAFRDTGGKLIIWVGTADQAAGVYSVPDYYQRVQNAAGGLEETRRFARLFQIPGVAHCGGGYMPFEEDVLGALVKWTEVGTAPEKIIVTAALQDGSVRTRPVYAYPVRAVYLGKGDINDARNFSGVIPKRAPNDLFDWLGSQTAGVEQ